MKKNIIIVSFFITILSCNSTQESNKKFVDSTSKPLQQSNKVETNITIDTTEIKPKENSKDILKLISSFSESEFRDARKELVEQGAEHQYKISEINKLGDILKYDVIIPSIEGKTIYTCNPKRGEITMTMTGEKEIIEMSYNKSKIGLKWDNCNSTEAGEQCDTYQEMQSIPLKTHFAISIVKQGNQAIYEFYRMIMPK